MGPFFGVKSIHVHMFDIIAKHITFIHICVSPYPSDQMAPTNKAQEIKEAKEKLQALLAEDRPLPKLPANKTPPRKTQTITNLTRPAKTNTAPPATPDRATLEALKKELEAKKADEKAEDEEEVSSSSEESEPDRKRPKKGDEVNRLWEPEQEAKKIDQERYNKQKNRRRWERDEMFRHQYAKWLAARVSRRVVNIVHDAAAERLHPDLWKHVGIIVCNF